MGAYSRWALIQGWALIRINTVYRPDKKIPVWSTKTAWRDCKSMYIYRCTYTSSNLESRLCSSKEKTTLCWRPSLTKILLFCSTADNDHNSKTMSQQCCNAVLRKNCRCESSRLISSLSSHDDSSENAAKKMNLCSFKLNRHYLDPLYLSNAGSFLRSWILKDCIQLNRKGFRAFTSSIKRCIRKFHVVAVQWTSRKYTYTWQRDLDAEMLFCS